MVTLKKLKTTPWDKDQFFQNEISAIKNAIGNLTTQSQYVCGRACAECFSDIRLPVSHFNTYGRIINKKAKGCSIFYNLLSLHDKKDGWDAACCSMERDLTDFDPYYIFEKDDFFQIVKKIMSLNFLIESKNS